MNHKRRIHDAIVEVVVTAGGARVLCGPLWLLVPAVIGVTLIVRDRYGTVSPLRGHLEDHRRSSPPSTSSRDRQDLHAFRLIRPGTAPIPSAAILQIA
jgi:hypothetical protein